MQAQRYWVERNFQDAKNQCGMGEYQARKWQSWHHHMAMVMMAMLFMVEQRIFYKDAYPLLSCFDIVCILKFLPSSKSSYAPGSYSANGNSPRKAMGINYVCLS